MKRTEEPKTFEQIKAEQLALYKMMPKFPSFGEPTYRFKVGDKVRMGNLKNCEINEVTEINGVLVYGITHDVNNQTGHFFQYFPWYNVRPFEIGKGETSFSQEDEIHISFYNTSLESLLNKFYLSGIDMEPSYQRDYVWEEEDKESLLDSIFNHIEIGKFAFIRRGYDSDAGYEILDGKQRLSTLLDFYENRLPYRGMYYNDLSAKDRYTFLNASVTIGETGNLTMEQIYRYFYTLNKAGKVMDKEHLEYIKSLIDKEKEIEQEERELKGTLQPEMKKMLEELGHKATQNGQFDETDCSISGKDSIKKEVQYKFDIAPVICELMTCFPKSRPIADGREFLVHPKGNVYFILENCESKLDIDCKVLEWCSRAAYKTEPYSSDWRNKEYHEYFREGISKYFDHEFDGGDMAIIYTYLGNACNHEKTIAFIESGFDLTILDERLSKYQAKEESDEEFGR